MSASGGINLKVWAGFLLFLAVILVSGILISQSGRRELGETFTYSLDAYREVDPALVTYREREPLQPKVGALKALAIHANDDLAVAGEEGVVLLDREGGEVLRFGLPASPTCLALSEEGGFVVGLGDRIAVFDSEGQALPGWKVPGDKAYLTSLALADRRIYAADAGARCVWVFDSEGKVENQITGRGEDRHIANFIIPSPFFDVAVGSDDSLWVVNPAYHALENYRSDGSLIGAWEKTGMTIEGFSGCCNPTHIALLADGSFVTSEKGLPRVKIHGPTGDLVAVVAPPASFDDEVEGLDLAVDSAGRIYVLDPQRNQVRVFVNKEAGS